MPQETISRRGLLRRAAAVAGFAGLADACAGPAKEAPPPGGKLTKAQAGYQFMPKGMQRCGVCANFRAPMDCVLVRGPIDPNGWCRRYQKRSA